MSWGSYITGIWTFLVLLGYVKAVEYGASTGVGVMTLFLVITAFLVGVVVGEDD